MSAKQLTIANHGDLFTSYLLVNFTGGDTVEYNVGSIDIYLDAALTILLVDDVRLSELPADVQENVIDGLAEETRAIARRAYAARVARNLQAELRVAMRPWVRA